MTLEEAIKHCEEKACAEENEECAKEHRQLRDWLIELKSFRLKASEEDALKRRVSALEQEAYDRTGAGKAEAFKRRSRFMRDGY